MLITVQSAFFNIITYLLLNSDYGIRCENDQWVTGLQVALTSIAIITYFPATYTLINGMTAC